MIIPLDYISIDHNSTEAWLTCPNEYDQANDQDWMHLAFWHASDRPCDYCKGTQLTPWEGSHQSPCTHCFNGRHFFEINIPKLCSFHDAKLGLQGYLDEGYCICNQFYDTYRASIVPNMVLEATNNDADCDAPRNIILFDDENTFICEGPKIFHQFITVPPITKFGDYVIQLRLNRVRNNDE